MPVRKQDGEGILIGVEWSGDNESPTKKERVRRMKVLKGRE